MTRDERHQASLDLLDAMEPVIERLNNRAGGMTRDDWVAIIMGVALSTVVDDEDTTMVRQESYRLVAQHVEMWYKMDMDEIALDPPV